MGIKVKARYENEMLKPFGKLELDEEEDMGIPKRLAKSGHEVNLFGMKYGMAKDVFEGKRYDAGDNMGYAKAIIDFSLERDILKKILRHIWRY